MDKLFYISFMVSCFSLIYCKPFQDQHMIGFPVDMPLPQASRDLNAGPFEPDAGPNTPDENFPIHPPFSQKCEQHVINSTDNGAPKHHMSQNDVLAFYPLKTDQPSRVTVVINIQDVIYKGIIIGSTFTVDQCDLAQQNCKNIEFQSAKGRDLINSNQWNYIYGTLMDKEIKLNINNASTIVFECEQSLEDMVDAEWYFGAENAVNNNTPESVTPSSSNHPVSDWYYVAQYPCAEYKSDIDNTVTRSSSQIGDSNIEEEKAETDSSSLIVGIVVGVGLLVIVAAIVAVVIIKSVKNRRSANISNGVKETK